MQPRQLTSKKMKEKFGLEVNAPVFFIAAGLIIFLVLLSLPFDEETSTAAVSKIQSFISHFAGWFYILIVNAILLFAIFLLFSPFGKIRLGGPDAEPEFTTWGWFAMLFSAGMGIGLVFWSVAEPIMHFASPPIGEPGGVDAARQAMRLTFYHWGFHPWGVYAVVGLALAFFSYNRGLPLTIRSVFYPILGKRIHSWIGDVIDITAVVATLFGVATSLGLGVQQVNAGLNFLFGISISSPVQVILIAIITGMATISVVLGLDAGIRRLSEMNIYLAGGLLLAIFLVGPSLFLLNAVVQNIGAYLQDLPRLATWTEAYSTSNWQDGWTIFYWGWWISWAPFVGMFIAQISRGRTVREFLLGVLLVPTTVTFVWLTFFGNTAIHEELTGAGGIVEAVNEDVAVALFVLLEKYPLAWLTSILGVVIVITFFVTSSDSGSLVIDVITAGGHTDPPVRQRIFWAVLEGAVAAALLLAGGLTALQTAAITTGLPFAIVLAFLCFGLYKGLKNAIAEDIEGHERYEIPKESPGRVEEVSVPEHGRGWLLLDWQPPVEGGNVAAYRIRRRRQGEEKWHDVAMCAQDTAAIHHREQEGVWEYVVIPVNKAGEGPMSDLVTVDFNIREGERIVKKK